MSRERMIPRGPKAYDHPHPPLGPRADYMSEYRGRGRGRGRGGFRDESRDRGRDLDRDRGFSRDYNHREDRPSRFREERSREREHDRDRDYRGIGADRRDSRGGRGGHTFRNEPSRDREWRDRETFHNNRRSRSPDMRAGRDSREGHLNLELDRTHRASREGPLSAGSSSSDPSVLAPSSQFNRGGYRGRGFGPRGDWDSRGGGRSRYADERYRARSRSPERDRGDLIRSRVDMREDRSRREERGPDMSRNLNDRRPSNWGSPLHSASGPSPASTHDDSRREEGEINREPRADLVPRRNPDGGPSRPSISSERPLPRANTQSPPMVTQVPAFGSVTSRPAPPPSTPSSATQDAAGDKTSSVPAAAPDLAVDKALPTPSPVQDSISEKTPIAPSPTPEISPAVEKPITSTLPIPTQIPPTSQNSLVTPSTANPLMNIGRTPPSGPKADRAKSTAESPISSIKDTRQSPRAGSNVSLSPLTPKEPQGVKTTSNLESGPIRGIINTATSRSQYFSHPKSLERTSPALQIFAGQKHARSDSDQDASYGAPIHTPTSAPSIPTEPRADRVRNISSPAKTNKPRYLPTPQALNTDVSTWPKSRDSRSIDSGLSQGNLTGREPCSQSSKSAGPQASKTEAETTTKSSEDERKVLQRRLIELKTKNKVEQYVLAHRSAQITRESSQSNREPSEKSAPKALLTRRPLEIDSRIIDDDNGSDSDSGDEDELDEEYFEDQDKKLTKELGEVENFTKPQEQLFPPCDLSIDELAFAEIHEPDVAIISDLPQKPHIPPIAKDSPHPVAEPIATPITAIDPTPKSETTDIQKIPPEAATKTISVTSPGTNVTVPAVSNHTLEPAIPEPTPIGRTTPSPSHLVIIPDAVQFQESSEFLQTFDVPTRLKDGLKDRMRKSRNLEKQLIKTERAEYAQHYKSYLHRVADLDAEKPRQPEPKNDTLSKDSRRPSTVPSIEGRPEGGRSTRNSHQSQLELEAVLRASEQEAQDAQKKYDNKAQSKPNYAIEAVIPDQLTPQKRAQTKFIDKTGLVPFHDAVDVFGFGEFRTDFTPEERKIFEKAYKKTPKQWGIIAEALPNRDFHDCIAHYYAVKGDESWPFKARKVRVPKPRGKRQSNKTLMAEARDLDLEDQNDGQHRRVTRGVSKATGSENVPSESEPNTPGKRANTPKSKEFMKPNRAPPALAKKITGNPNPNSAVNPQEKQKKKPGPRAAGAKKARNQATPGLSPHGGSEDPARTNEKPRLPIFGQGYEGHAELTDHSFPKFVPREQSTAPGDMPINPATQVFNVDNTVGATATQQQSPFDNQLQPRRGGLTSTSSYWSVPEQNEFPNLLKQFGTDWDRIAKQMVSKTHIMVKNYYSRQVEQGKRELEDFAQEGDARRAQGKTMDIPPPSSVPSKRPYNTGPRIAPAISPSFDEVPPKQQPSSLQPTPSSQPSLSSRFPALAQAGPVPHTSPEASHIAPASQKQFARPTQQAQQNVQPRPFPTPRGQQMGLFSDSRERPIMSASATTPLPPKAFPISSQEQQQRSLLVAQAARDAENERKQALRLEQEQKERIALQREQDRQQAQLMQEQHDRMRLKQESTPESQNIRQFEPYPTYPQLAPPRVESRVSSPASDLRHSQQQYVSRGHQGMRNIMSETAPPSPHVTHLSSSSAGIRPPLDTKTTIPQQYSLPTTPVQLPPPPPKEPTRNVSIMSLLNDEPSDPRPAPPKRVNEVASNTIPRSQSPILQQPTYQASRNQTSQPTLRRESSLSDIQTVPQSYGTPSQGSMRLMESPYSTAGQPRSQIASPMDSSPASDREYFRQKAYSLPAQQMPGSGAQTNAPYQNQQSHQSNHRMLAFGQSQRTASPPSAQYQPQGHVSSRHNSFDARQGPPSSATQQTAFGHQHQGSPMSVHHQHTHQHPLQNSRYGSQQQATSQVQPLSHSRAPSQQHHYSQNSPHSVPQSAGPIRSYTPLSYESRPPYGISSPAAGLQQQQQPLSHEQQSMLRREIAPQQQQQEPVAMRQEQQHRQHDGPRYSESGYHYSSERRDDRRDEYGR